MPHVENLFSPAYDSRLTEGQRRDFSSHLRECTACADAYREFRAGVELIREMPAARMPVQVHLPEGSPRAARRSWFPALPRFTPISPAAGGALASLAAVAAVVLVSTHMGHSGSATTTLAGGAQQQSMAPQADRQAPMAGGNAAGAAAPPADAFNAAGAGGGNIARISAPQANHTEVSTPQRPGEVLVLSTAQGSYRPGAVVPIHAVLVEASGGTVRAAITVEGTGATPLPLVTQSATGEPVEYLTVPRVTDGTLIRIHASVPAGTPRPGEPLISAVLVIQVCSQDAC
jgi:anti-sigma factor RsiW